CPQRLSGCEQQRVASARALVHDTALLLLAEPLWAHDTCTRMEMQELIESLWQQGQFTSIRVTHDVEEAVTLAERVILIEDGQITMNQTIDLPRPRHRTNPAFSMCVEEGMGSIMNYKVKQEFIVEAKGPT